MGTCDPTKPGYDTCGQPLITYCSDPATCTDNCGMKNPSICGPTCDDANPGFDTCGRAAPDCKPDAGIDDDGGHDAGDAGDASDAADAGDAGDAGDAADAADASGRPTVSAFSSVFTQSCFCTVYTVTAMQPGAGTLSYSWTNSNPCGQFVGGNSPTATWYHPDSNMPGACPVESIHPGTITVVVTGTGGSVTCAYSGGSGDGTTAECTPGP
jgi:hypothetical protein